MTFSEMVPQIMKLQRVKKKKVEEKILAKHQLPVKGLAAIAVFRFSRIAPLGG